MNNVILYFNINNNYIKLRRKKTVLKVNNNTAMNNYRDMSREY